MARTLGLDDDDDHKGHNRKGLIDALLDHRRPPLIDDHKLLKRIESKTSQHRSPFSANISRKHASILSAMSPPGTEKPKLGHKRTLTPTREASQRRAFEAFEWDRDLEPLVPEDDARVDAEVAKEVWSNPPAPRRVLTKYMASLRSEEEEEPGYPEPEPDPDPTPDQEPVPEPEPEPEPEYIPEAEDLVDDEMLEKAKALMAASGPEPAEATEEEEEPEVPEAVEPAGVPSAPPAEVVVEGRPGHVPREGGEFPVYLMEAVDEADVEGASVPDVPQREEEGRELTVLTYDHETDMTVDEEVTPEESETDTSLVGLGQPRRWPSDTGLELHIDGFEHMASTSDLCPRCGRRVTARNRLLTCNDCGAVACETCEIKTTSQVDSPYYYDWHFELPLCVNCYDRAFTIQKLLAKAKAALGMGNHTYAFYHAQQALRLDPSSPYSEEAQRIIAQVDRRRRESAEQDEAWKRQRSKMSRTSVVHED